MDTSRVRNALVAVLSLPSILASAFAKKKKKKWKALHKIALLRKGIHPLWRKMEYIPWGSIGCCLVNKPTRSFAKVPKPIFLQKNHCFERPCMVPLSTITLYSAIIQMRQGGWLCSTNQSFGDVRLGNQFFVKIKSLTKQWTCPSKSPPCRL